MSEQEPILGGEPTEPEDIKTYRRLVDEVLTAVSEGREAPAATLKDIVGYLDVGGMSYEGRLVPPWWLPVWDDNARQALADGDQVWMPLEEICDSERVAALIAGTVQPTDEELLHVAKTYVEVAQTDDDRADSFAGTYPFSLVGSDGREASVYLYVSGFSFSGIDYEIDGPFETEAELDEARRRRGFCDPDEVTLDDVAVMRGEGAA